MDSAQEFSCDKQGRIKLHENLIEKTSLKKGVVFTRESGHLQHLQ